MVVTVVTAPVACAEVTVVVMVGMLRAGMGAVSGEEVWRSGAAGAGVANVKREDADGLFFPCLAIAGRKSPLLYLASEVRTSLDDHTGPALRRHTGGRCAFYERCD